MNGNDLMKEGEEIRRDVSFNTRLVLLRFPMIINWDYLCKSALKKQTVKRNHRKVESDHRKVEHE